MKTTAEQRESFFERFMSHAQQKSTNNDFLCDLMLDFRILEAALAAETARREEAEINEQKAYRAGNDAGYKAGLEDGYKEGLKDVQDTYGKY